MIDERRRLATEEDVERLYRARRRGGECAACGRELAADEPVYVEQFEDFRRRGRGRGRQAQGPVGAECASARVLQGVANREPERCAGCGRAVYYGLESPRERRQALCSQACRALILRRRRAGG